MDKPSDFWSIIRTALLAAASCVSLTAQITPDSPWSEVQLPFDIGASFAETNLWGGSCLGAG